MAQKKVAQELARELYLHSDRSFKEIADLVNVRPATVSDWCDKGQWKTLKTSKSITEPQLIANYYAAIQRLQKIIAERPAPNNIPTPAEADTLSKMHTSIQKLKRTTSLEDIVKALDEFLSFLLKNRPDLAKEVAPDLYRFAEIKAAELIR
jgi:hypothetical protein